MSTPQSRRAADARFLRIAEWSVVAKWDLRLAIAAKMQRAGVLRFLLERKS